MSQTIFDENDFIKRVPKKILERTRENMEVYHMDLADSFQEATRELAKKGTTLWKAWYYDDFREYVPCIYRPEYLDLSKYPLNWNTVIIKDCDYTVDKVVRRTSMSAWGAY